MRKSNLLVLAASVLVLAPSAVHAADAPGVSPMAAPAAPLAAPQVFSWTGYYVGAFAGYGWGDSTGTGVAGGPFDDAVGTSIDLDPDGFAGGLTLGANWQYNQFVFGIEGEVGYLGLDDDETVGDNFGEVEYGAYGTVAGRLGFAWDRFLVFGKGGLAIADIDQLYSDLDGPIDPTDVTREGDTEFGYVLGAGIEYAFSGGWTAKVEYNYMDFGDQNSGNLDGDVFELDNDLHIVKVGVNYLF